MAKNMARLEDGVVINIEWCSDEEAESETLVDMGDIPAGIGDMYSEGAFYRDGVKLLTPLEQAYAQQQAMLEQMNAAYQEGVKSA